jgi:hypothetical protein
MHGLDEQGQLLSSFSHIGDTCGEPEPQNLHVTHSAGAYPLN